jgi:hypothetical protein
VQVRPELLEGPVEEVVGRAQPFQVAGGAEGPLAEPAAAGLSRSVRSRRRTRRSGNSWAANEAASRPLTGRRAEAGGR